MDTEIFFYLSNQCFLSDVIANAINYVNWFFSFISGIVYWRYDYDEDDELLGKELCMKCVLITKSEGLHFLKKVQCIKYVHVMNFLYLLIEK